MVRHIFIVGFLMAVSACSQDKWVEGGLYSTPNKNGGYVVLKILKIDEVGVHVRLYSNQFLKHPTDVDETKLYMAGMNRKPNEELGLGHLPLRKDSFTSWKPQFIKVVPVREDELDGYKIWQEGGGYF